MSQFEKIHKAWLEAANDVNRSDWFQRLSRGNLKLFHYKGYLLETYHHAGLNPQIQAYATMFFKGNPRELIRKFLKHATSEIAHDVLAANDLVALGVDQGFIQSTKPLPSTLALNAFVLYLIQFIGPVSYLGYLFHLEYLPTKFGPSYISSLVKMGVPKNALSFLEEHASVDVGHNLLMRQYIDELVTSQKDVDEVVYAARATATLHRRMIEDALENGESIFNPLELKSAPSK